MRREIKFRGKDINGNWVYGYLYKNGSISQIIEPTPHNGRGYICHDVDPNTVGQFIGLFDKNGKEIYEGDILDTEDDGHRLEIRYEESEASFVCASNATWYRLFSDYNLEVFEVVGNIYDDPELVKEWSL